VHRLTDEPPRDQGAVLVLTLVLCVILGAVASALATYAVVGLRTTGVTDRRLERIAATDGGLRAAAEILKQNPANCAGGAPKVVIEVDGASVTAWCEQAGAATTQWTPYRLHATAVRGAETASAVADVQGRTSSYGPCVTGQRCIISINSWAVVG
jgi:hypothetical protein